MKNIVVGVDGSEHSSLALRWAYREAELHGAAVRAVLVWDLFNQRHPDGSRRFDPDYDDAHADEALRTEVEAALGPDAAAVRRQTVVDVPAQGLLEAGAGADLLVVGARGLGGFRGLLLGSVSQQVLHHATVPLAIVRELGDEDGNEATDDEAAADADTGAGSGAGSDAGELIVVGVDGSDPSNAALRWALTEGKVRDATVEVVHAWQVPATFHPVLSGGFRYDTDAARADASRLVDDIVDQAIAATGAVDVTVERTVVGGGAASSLLDAAEGADLVVIGRRGIGGFTRLLLGSVSENVARHVPCPVVVTPPQPEPESGS
jgi:nucleotide-binding universal stress UspA family protein